MAKASSSKKVQRAARAAASSKGASERRQLGFPLIVVLVVVLGVVLVVVARGSRDPLTSPTTADHWHSAYAIYNCGVQMPHFQGQTDPDGIHSHGDSLIHIHPYNSSATGEDARLGVFLDTMNASIEVDGIFTDNGEFAPILAEDGCDGEPAEIKVARWSLGASDGPEIIEVYEDDFDDIRLLDDGEGFSFALVPVGEDPPPPDAEVISSLVGVGAEIDWEIPDPAVTTTPAPIPDDTESEAPVEEVVVPVEVDVPVEEIVVPLEESDGSDG
ncbi:MAG: hypothetical protein OXF75_09340 [Acidimicrobiaceae bacterium]|nr:hypothetical protein [Acidimicrobiaceae bacterium]